MKTLPLAYRRPIHFWYLHRRITVLVRTWNMSLECPMFVVLDLEDLPLVMG